jgi:hypothetical protein
MNYYPPFRVPATISDEHIRSSLYHLSRMTEIVKRIDVIDDFKIIHIDQEAEDIDYPIDAFWSFLDTFERNGYLWIYMVDTGDESKPLDEYGHDYWHCCKKERNIAEDANVRFKIEYVDKGISIRHGKHGNQESEDTNS